MSNLYIVAWFVASLISLKVIKGLFFKKTVKLFTMALLVIILFLLLSYAFKDISSFQDNKFVQTGAVVAEKIIGAFKENVDTEQILNSTLKSNKLFKDARNIYK